MSVGRFADEMVRISVISKKQLQKAMTFFSSLDCLRNF